MLIKWYKVGFMTGLIIRSPWIEKILAGEKTWEIRSSNTNVRGPIALIRGGSGLVVGTCDLVDCIGPLTLQELQENEDKTGIPTEQVRFITYARPHAWVLWNARALNPPRPYNHPPGAVIWVNLPKI
jgi:hypothetical protein